ncbi:aminopeptidase N [Thiosulfativibrio zosterae]|uniref:Aminopeptidase N n=1 Tax=Thiosulfativibrio zosterae TaxID=2675053 RepID=A0A6F8PPF1_9GAMM|nr:aminopeptidase N [Thiosulfativibrio zosterae]BBP43993.1 aminopeptidase N [Thiosulfativibrio zosterae]
MSSSLPVTHYLKDYQPSNYQIDSIELTFDLDPLATRVTNVMQMTFSPNASDDRRLVLNGQKITLLECWINGNLLSAEDYDLDDEFLTLSPSLDAFELKIVTQCAPQNNTSLEGLYRTSGNYCTQCEALGFQTITYYLDRPDVLSFFTTKIIADKSQNAVLLSNGNLVEASDLPDGKHYAVWHDPFKKPCYLFALVAGNLSLIQDTYQTMDGRLVDLRIYVEPQNIDKCDHAMASLKKSMQWDEERYGLVYDLDIYMIVAVDDFNMGAMENKGLNVFNSKFVLAKPETATDVDYEGIESVIAHEYFHNWTGNRVTCRDWFQLTLKEGLTVFRDQEFTGDMLSIPVKRIEDVKRLRSNQFPEDAGPMAHPIQPQSYIEMNNFYTMTVYEKGAEVVRLYQTLLGRDGFRKGMDLYFQRHDGQAVTVEDFRNAMADANHVDLSQMQAWYVQEGTPVVTAKTHYDAKLQTLTLSLEQTLKGKVPQQPLMIPVLIGFMGYDGQPLTLMPSVQDKNSLEERGDSWLLKLTEPKQDFIFEQVATYPVISYLRDFSAPIILKTPNALPELEVLAQYDSNAFVRWESMQALALASMEQGVSAYQQQQPLTLLPSFAAAFASVLADSSLDLSLKALALTLPEMTYVADQYTEIPLEAIQAVHQFTQQALAEKFSQALLQTYESLQVNEPYRYEKQAIAQRKLKNVCLKYLAKLPQNLAIAVNQFEQKSNMTDVLSALEVLSHHQTADSAKCLQAFYQDWSKDSLVLDKWFSIQAAAQVPDILAQINQLLQHPDFKYTNPNRVRSVLGVFGRLNWVGFHQASGTGYQLLAEQVIKLNGINPQIASRLVAPLSHWKRYDSGRRLLMRQALESILATENLSKDVYEIVSRSLA